MILHNLANRKTGGYTTFSSVWKQGELMKSNFVFQTEDGEQILLQSRAMSWWPDGSVKWFSHTADSAQMGNSVMLLPVEFKETAAIVDVGTGIRISETDKGYEVCTGPLSATILKSDCHPCRVLVENICINGVKLAEKMFPVFLIERRETKEGETTIFNRNITEYHGKVESVVLEEAGPIETVFCLRGSHVTGEEATMPFIIRIYFGYNSPEIRFTHTFLYDGEESRDFLKGMGIRIETLLTGKPSDKLVQIAGEENLFQEAAVILTSSHPKLSPDILKRQLQGECLTYDEESEIGRAAASLPVWDRYLICQDSVSHFAIKKQTQPECCMLTCMEGKRGMGAMSIGGRNGSLLFGSRDFWQKYPSGFEVNDLSKDNNSCTIWFYSPEAEAYDFRHYDTRSYPQTCYEGFDEVGASAVGIGVSSECTVRFMEDSPTDKEVLSFGERMQKPAMYVGTPDYYYEKNAFGYWSLPAYDTKAKKWIEEQIEKAFLFYQNEIEARNWYGLFDYGDVMHTYDAVRHSWKYDMGGFAWQNTELVPTYWLWLYFLRTGREDVFTMAEAMSRHCSEVDVYHFGKYKGLGSRHNVRHWGCSCKEPRIAMAGHYRFLYYLTGERRMGDIFDDVKDADHTMSNLNNSNVVLPDGSHRPGVRSGPDWSSYVSNWMTQYERTLDVAYREKIETGIRDIVATPFGFASGPEYYYEVNKAHLIYRGENENTPNQHLQICMGGPQIWWEAADMLGDDTLKTMLADLGGFYFLSKQDKMRLTDGKIVERPFSWPMFATGIAAYGALIKQDKALAIQAWKILLENLIHNGGKEGFSPVAYAEDSEGSKRWEIPWISTNITSQWCLNAMMCLEFIGEYLEEVYEEVTRER